MDLIGYNKRVQKDKVTGFEKFAYGCGEISTNIVFTIATSLLTMFYTDVAHVSAATIGMIIAISQIFNGASDICAGFILYQFFVFTQNLKQSHECQDHMQSQLFY